MEFIADASGRLDALIAAQDNSLSRVKIQKAISSGLVMVNGEVVRKPAYQVEEQDVVSIAGQLDIKKSRNQEIKTVDQHLPVLYEDDACMALNKPVGIAVHPGHAMDNAEETLLSGIRFLFEERGIPFSADSVLVHRLDKPTTGCILVAKTNNSFQLLQKQFEERSVEKQYLAIVAGIPEHAEATIDAPIGRNLTDRTKMSVLKTSSSREAQTSYRVLDTAADCALLLCTLHTGRTHQIRVHLTSIGHPLLGDETYHSSVSNALSEQYNISGLCLHAFSLSFTSPETMQRVMVEAPLPETFTTALEASSLQLAQS